MTPHAPPPDPSSVQALLDEAARAAAQQGDAAALAVLERDAASAQVPLLGFARGALLQRLGRRAEALDVLRAVIAAEPTVPAFAAQLAAVLLDGQRSEDDRGDDAIAEAEAALVAGVRQRDPLCLALAARVSTLRGHHQAALHLLDRACAAAGDDDELRAELTAARARAAQAPPRS